MRPTPNTARVVGLVTTNPAEAAATGADRATTQTRINNEIPTVFLMRVTPFGKLGLRPNAARRVPTISVSEILHCSSVHHPITLLSGNAILCAIFPLVV